MYNLIALDGPSGVGKSTTAKRLASSLGWDYMDTGAMYRAATLAIQRAGAPLEDKDKVGAVLASLEYEQKGPSYFLNGEDISEAIRCPDVTKKVSAVSADARVREVLVCHQRKLGERGNWIVDGRDIGTVVFPQAICKIFLVASPEARANRRFLELRAKGLATTFEEVLADQARRDHLDSTRETSPLRKADDAFELDSSNLSQEEVVEKIIQIYRGLAGSVGVDS
ncbi:MAG: (d)CMP kinase [Holophagaceae bacterium]|nr:(d)CMP kinase [Holophagaceae bacterium]